MTFGPLQFVVLGVRGDEQQQATTRTLRALTERGAIRVVDMIYVTKQADGTWTPGRVSSMSDEERKRLGVVAGALIGVGYASADGARTDTEFVATSNDGNDSVEWEFGENLEEIRRHLRDIGQDLPTGAGCAIALIEHRWMSHLKDELRKNGVVLLASGMIRPRSLVMFGRELAEAEQAAQ